MSEPNFYLVIDKETRGPFPASQVGAMLSHQQINESTLAMKVGDSEQKWRPLFSYFDGNDSEPATMGGTPSQPAGALPSTGGSGGGDRNDQGGNNDGNTLVLPVIPGVKGGSPELNPPPIPSASPGPIPSVHGSGGSAGSSSASGQWEYHVIEQASQASPQDINAKCNQLGSEGWELSGLFNASAQVVMIFKRQK